ncbi:MAG: CsgG/HfaB family protein, partial [Treponema sp.]|nr:CsgG/HfaB family protein [Treponema sp.]
MKRNQQYLALTAFIALNSLFVALLSACASKPVVNPDEVSLNTAIRQAASRMEMRLDAGTKVALINFTSPSQAFSEYVLDELSSVLVNGGMLVVVDRANLDKIRQELGFNTSGEVSDASMQQIGEMLGAQALVTGSLASIGDLQRVMFKVIMTETATVTVQHPADIINDQRVKVLLASGGGSQGLSYGGTSSGRGTQTAGASGGGSSSGNQAATGDAIPARTAAVVYKIG